MRTIHFVTDAAPVAAVADGNAGALRRRSLCRGASAGVRLVVQGELA